ncbi:hypothetical protein AgCh_021108 [Apium graveolens]
MSRGKHNGGLGFRQLYDFNISLLGRQGWRLITEQNSLASQIFKARYYPDGYFLTAKLGNNPSHIWRSILEAHALLKKGAVHCVGNEKDVHINTEPWLPCVDNPYVETRHDSLREISSGYQLITRIESEENQEYQGQGLKKRHGS